ncbi:hypothetical protein JCM19037_710 [Geomicrobium sp. JCM 19037]|uniref:hypothetical protein n=1 Tax=unclassified Geomicrobium TaxID=2628951 RepID=UPI00045F4520|nr:MULTISPECIES: hypothetical protein [unclassified Geomicrobium]GAK02475.1 hypothetical protein JCM19037_710 [Geomicrobium sp. JCM 19037]GAK11176.1 hypothetical protein JCM19039_857 [Geomicrobium sp. JCM 19039]
MKFKTAMMSMIVFLAFLAPTTQTLAAYGEEAGSDASTFLVFSLSAFSIVTLVYLVVSAFKDNNS